MLKKTVVILSDEAGGTHKLPLKEMTLTLDGGTFRPAYSWENILRILLDGRTSNLQNLYKNNGEDKIKEKYHNNNAIFLIRRKMNMINMFQINYR